MLCLYNINPFTIAVNYYPSAHYGKGTGPTWLNYLYCTGSENNLLDCNRAYAIGNPSSCSHSEDVSIMCPGNNGNVVKLS